MFLWSALDDFGIQAEISQGFFIFDQPRCCDEGLAEELHTWLTVSLRGQSYLVDLTVRQFQEGCSHPLPPYLMESANSEWKRHYREYRRFAGQEDAKAAHRDEVSILLKAFLRNAGKGRP